MSKQIPSVGRIVHVYSPRFGGVRAGIICDAPGSPDDPDALCDVSVVLNLAFTKDIEALDKARDESGDPALPGIVLRGQCIYAPDDGPEGEARFNGTFCRWPAFVAPKPAN